MAAQIIHHWESYFGQLHGGRSLAEHAARSPNPMLDTTLPAAGLAGNATTTARVSGSCWIADCPNPDCAGAEFVNFTDPRFFCCACRNASWNHQPLPVQLPTDKMRAQIETVLLERPLPDTRNWAPGETIADLKRENREHGLTP